MLSSLSERVLVPFDGSARARHALNEPHESFNVNEIVLLYVIDTADFSHGPEGGVAERLYEAKKEDAKALFDEAQDIADEYNVSVNCLYRPHRNTDRSMDHNSRRKPRKSRLVLRVPEAFRAKELTRSIRHSDAAVQTTYSGLVLYYNVSVDAVIRVCRGDTRLFSGYV